MVRTLVVAVLGAALLATRLQALTHLVTGANGYLGRAIVHELMWGEGQIICLVRRNRLMAEEAYWEPDNREGRIRVMEYDMLDGGLTLDKALQACEAGPICVYHTASVFGPTEDHRETALGNVQGTVDVVGTLAKYNDCKLILTSSMAAVRGTGQTPKNGKFYTKEDWNTQSKLGENWGSSYQWSKATSEQRASELCDKLGLPMVALCPSFVFGPPYGESGSYSLKLVGKWVRGQSEVQSRLFVDIRDVAKAHVKAAQLDYKLLPMRFIVSTETRVPSSEIAEYLREVCQATELADPAKVHFDADFDGGAIPIGEKEVEATEHLRELGVKVRPVKDTIADMARILLMEQIG